MRNMCVIEEDMLIDIHGVSEEWAVKSLINNILIRERTGR